MSNNNTGFTLVELLVVIAILGLVVSLVGPQVMRQFSGAKVDAARLQIADLSSALDLYFLDNGRYPSTGEGLRVLIVEPSSLDTWDGPYLKKSAIPADPWGHPYQYKAPGDNGPYDLLSLGADRQPGGSKDNADILNLD